MLQQKLRDAIKVALRAHEIGQASPYRLSFAGKGNSGASFGAMQGDTSAQPGARETLRAVLSAASVAPFRITSIVTALAEPCITNPLGTADTQLVNDALDSETGRALVDAMDAEILADIYDDLDDCFDAARQANRSIDDEALIYIALWVNMSGKPTSLKEWLAGSAPVFLDHHQNRVDPPGPTIDRAAIERYLAATQYYSANKKNLAHLEEAVDEGLPLLA
jgi:hypothetical protein